MTDRCSSCGRPLLWSGGRLICGNANCTGGHTDLTAHADSPSPSVIGVTRRQWLSANPPTIGFCVGGHRALGAGSTFGGDFPSPPRSGVSLPDVQRLQP